MVDSRGNGISLSIRQANKGLSTRVDMIRQK